MPRLTDIPTVRTLLERDRAWAAYAIGDLAPGYIDHCEWFASADDAPALVLVYRGFRPHIVFAMGDPRLLRELFREMNVADISLHVRPEAIEALRGIYAVRHTQPMLRMTLSAETFRPAGGRAQAAGTAPVTPLTEQHLAAVNALYEDGRATGEEPTFFSASMLQQNTFRGVWEDDQLIAIAGTHLFSPELSVCAVGNIYTRRDRRGRGLAAAATSAVVAHALAHDVQTIVLNVNQTNTTARRVYERLGFTSHGVFFEGEAERVAPLSAPAS